MRALRFGRVYWRAAAGSAYALSLGLRHRRHRGLLCDIARHFGYDSATADARLPVIAVDEVLPPGSPIDLRELQSVDGNVSPLELIVLAGVAARLRARAVFEIGTFDGRTAVNLAANGAADGVVHTLDLPLDGEPTRLVAEVHDHKYMQPTVSGSRIQRSPLASRIRRLYGDSATFDFTPYAEAMDLCFVDGAHSYEYVLNDSRRALEITHPGSVILWHDYAMWPGVTRALNELREAGGAFGGIRWIQGTTLAVLTVGANAT